MRFSDFYKINSFSISFEIFPPKTPEGVTNLFSALSELKKFNPSFVSVTYGAMGSTRSLTGDLATRIKKEIGVETAFHFTCVGSSRDEIKKYVEHLKAEGINLIVALRGDAPKGASDFVAPADGFKYANELVGYLKSIDGFSMAVAGYPEKHIEAVDAETDLKNLKRKVEAGADVVITQLFFDNAYYFDFVEKARKVGITIPIIPGIMPILNLAQVERLSDPIGVKIPKKLHDALKACGDDTDKMRDVGVAHALNQCLELKAQGAPGIHFYMLNKAYSVKSILERL